MGMVKEIGAKWLVDMVKYISDNPQFIVNGFIHAGIAKALNGEDLFISLGGYCYYHI